MPSTAAEPAAEPSGGTTSPRIVVAAADGLHDATGATRQLAGRGVTAVAVDGDDLWALADRTDLFRISAGMSHRVAALDGPVGTCLHVHRGTVFVGGDAAGLWALREGSLEPVASFQHAPTRADWGTPWGGPPAVFSMASHGDDLYVSVHVGGILHSADNGETWAATIDLHDDVHQVAVDPGDGTVWAATGRQGLAQSTDRGRRWRHHTDGLHATYLLAVAVTGAGVLVSASSGHAATDSAVYVFDGATFHRAEGLPGALGGAVGPRHIAGSGDHAASITSAGSLFRSDDGGHRWRMAGGPFRSPAEVGITTVSKPLVDQEDTP